VRIEWTLFAMNDREAIFDYLEAELSKLAEQWGQWRSFIGQGSAATGFGEKRLGRRASAAPTELGIILHRYPSPSGLG
jgi:plasmid stabilization system protein ParE